MYDVSSFESAFGSMFGALVGFLVVFAIIGLALLILIIVGLAKIFKKAGEEGWKAIIPFYNIWVLVKILGLNWWWFLIYLAPSILGLVSVSLSSVAYIAELVASIVIYYNLTKKMGKTTGYIVLLVFFPYVMIPVLGLGSSKWDASVEVPSNGCFGGAPLK